MRRCKFVIVLTAALGLAVPVVSQTPVAKKQTVLMEEMTWTEIRDAIRSGKTTVLLVAGIYRAARTAPPHCDGLACRQVPGPAGCFAAR